MANKFTIIISATDRATATINKINRRFARFTQPFSRLQRSMKTLSRAAGFDRLGKSLVKVGRSVMDIGAQLRSMLGPLGAIFGVGSVAAVLSLAKAFGRLGFNIWQSSITLGIGVGQLQRWRGAGRVMGISAETMTGSIKALGDTMEDALYGRNQEALMMFSQLGIGLHKTASGAMDTNRALLDVAKAIQRFKGMPQRQSLIARSLGVEQLLPLLRQGPKAIEAYERKVQELGGVMSKQAIRKANQFWMSLNFLDVAMGGLKNTIGSKLIPILQPLIERFTQWIAANRQIIATRIAQFVRGFARAIDSVNWPGVLKGLEAFGHGLMTAIRFVGGFKNAALLLAAALGGRMLANVGKAGLALGGLARDVLRPLNIGLMATARNSNALIASLGKVGMLSEAFAGGYGLGKLLNYGTGKLIELTTGKRGLDLSSTVADMFGPQYNPNALAYAGAGPSPVATPFTARGRAPGAQTGHVAVDVRFHNAPDNVRTTTRSSGSAVSSTRVERAMPTAVTP